MSEVNLIDVSTRENVTWAVIVLPNINNVSPCAYLPVADTVSKVYLGKARVVLDSLNLTITNIKSKCSNNPEPAERRQEGGLDHDSSRLLQDHLDL